MAFYDDERLKNLINNKGWNNKPTKKINI